MFRVWGVRLRAGILNVRASGGDGLCLEDHMLLRIYVGIAAGTD